MARRPYSPEYKAKLVIEVLQGEKELNTIAGENSISPNMLRNWKAEFLENASRAFDGSRQAKEARRKEADLKKTQAQMLKTIPKPQNLTQGHRRLHPAVQYGAAASVAGL